MNRRRHTHGNILPLLLGVTLLASAGGRSGESWFPANGPVALHQRCLDVEQTAVAMIVALQPGYEDLPLMAYLRMHQGARTVVAFLTNGEGTPGDTLGRFPAWMTGERKLEADRVASLLDAEGWFVNIPDVPGAGTAATLKALWDSVGATGRLTEAIRRYQPDVIVICPDRRVTGGTSIRDIVALDVLRKAVARAATTVDTSRHADLLPWSVSRIIMQTREAGLPGAFWNKHPLLNISPMMVAQSVSRCYRTMRLQIGDWIADGREYRDVRGTGMAGRRVAPEQLLRGLPEISARMKSIEQAIRSAVKIGRQGIRSASLTPVSHAIDVTEHVLATQRGALTRPEQGLMVAWKNGLEALRCVVLGVSVHVVPSESLLTASQLFYLRVEPPHQLQGQTEIVFPAAGNDEWIINGGNGYHFPLDSASKFSIVTPEKIPIALPAGEYGLTQPEMTFPFPYVVVHKDPRREHNFMYRDIIRLHIGPRRSFTLRTPLLFDDGSSAVIFEMQNFSRDGLKGTVTLSDTSGHLTQVPFSFAHKDQIVMDTLYLPGDPPEGEGSRPFTLELSGRGGRRSITAQRFSAAVDSTVGVMLLTTVDSSPLADALQVLRQPYGAVPLNEAAASLNSRHIVIVDRDLLSDTLCTATTRQALAEWIRAGGHAILFPQHGRGTSWLTALCGATFEPIDPLPPEADVTTDTSALFSTPNHVTRADWNGWVESRAFVNARLSAPQTGAVQRAWSGPHLLVLTVPAGRGSVTLVAADLLSQFTNCHPGAHRILANLIAHGADR